MFEWLYTMPALPLATDPPLTPHPALQGARCVRVVLHDACPDSPRGRGGDGIPDPELGATAAAGMEVCICVGEGEHAPVCIMPMSSCATPPYFLADLPHGELQHPL